VLPATHEAAAVYTDDWCVYTSLPGHGRYHAAVNHTDYEWARDDDGDGER
jgi:IS1 family transposase